MLGGAEGAFCLPLSGICATQGANPSSSEAPEGPRWRLSSPWPKCVD